MFWDPVQRKVTVGWPLCFPDFSLTDIEPQGGAGPALGQMLAQKVLLPSHHDTASHHAYALMKSVHLGFPVSDTYAEKSRRIFNSVLKEKLKSDGEVLKLTDICSSAGLGPGKQRNGTAEYYFSELIVSDDPKGVGALMMAYSEILNDDMLKAEGTT